MLLSNDKLTGAGRLGPELKCFLNVKSNLVQGHKKQIVIDIKPQVQIFCFYFPTSSGVLPLSRDINKQQWRMMTHKNRHSKHTELKTLGFIV